MRPVDEETWAWRAHRSACRPRRVADAAVDRVVFHVGVEAHHVEFELLA